MRPTGRGALLFVLLCSLPGLCRWVTDLGCFYGLLPSSHPSPEAHSRRTRKSTTHRPFGPHPHALAGRGGQRRAAAGSGVLRVSSHPPFAGKVREHCGGASPVANAVGVLHGGRLAGRGAVGCRWLAALTWAQPIFRLSPNA